ncbi:hypothetical protein AALA78_01180 [Lachnospiraceae bacterium 42-17]|jgi:DNA-directed RNA polymerase specialized sigma24 family protein
MEMNSYDEAVSSVLPAISNNPEDELIEIDSREFIIKQILKHDEIAQLMDISRSSVKRYLISGRAHLEKTLRQ